MASNSRRRSSSSGSRAISSRKVALVRVALCAVRNDLAMPPLLHRVHLREGPLKQARVDRLREAVLARFAGTLLIDRAADTVMVICAR